MRGWRSPLTSQQAAALGRRGGLAAVASGAHARNVRKAGRRRRPRSALLSSFSEEWATPDVLYHELDAEFQFTVDVCASADNAKYSRYWTKADDGLAQPWAGERCFMNPPYGRAIARWVEKAAREAAAGALVVALLPARTDTRWWQRHVLAAGEVRFLPGRLRFNGAKTGAPFPSAVVVFRPPVAAGSLV